MRIRLAVRRSLSSRVGQIGIVLTLSLVVRLILFMNFPVALTADSWDYLSAAEGLYQHADFDSYAMRDLRLPAYPIFLAATYPLTEMRADRIVVSQAIIGMFNVLLGMILGYRLGSRLAAIGLGLWLGLSPVYLLNEHMVMTETLCLFGLLLFTIITISFITGELNWRKGLAGGLAMALCALIRPNTLPFCMVLLLGALVYRKITLRASGQVIARRAMLTFLAALLVGVGVLMGPWLWRNFRLYHNISLANFNNRNILIFKVMHNRFDSTLPILQQINGSLGSSTVDFAWLLQLSRTHRTNEAERIAGELFWEQVLAHPLWYLQDVAESAIDFGGFYDSTGNDRTPLLYWFKTIVNNPQQWSQINTPSWAQSRSPDFKNVSVMGNAYWGTLWSTAGQFYLRIIRPALYVLCLVLIMVYFGQKRLKAFKVIHLPEQLIVLLTGGYLVTIVLHAATLLDSDRYTSLFDWVALLIVLLIVETYYRSRGSHLRLV